MALTARPVLAIGISQPTSTRDLPTLRSNIGGAVDEACIEWMRATTLDTPIDEIRRRFDKEGYIWVKHLIPREDVLDAREAYFDHLKPTGILEEGSSPRDGIFNSKEDPMEHCGIGGPDLPSEQEKLRRLTEAHTMPFYTQFLEHEKLRAFIRKFMKWDKELMIVRNMLRHNVPHGTSTGIHYDRIFLRAGESEFLTAWIPIGDCAADGGGLAYLKNSTELGKKTEADFMARTSDMSDEERIFAFNKNMMRDGQLSHDMSTFGTESDTKAIWLVANYEAGDVVFHNPYLIHGAARNEDKLGRIRLSSDVRFYEDGSHYDERWMKAWRPNDGL